MEIQSTKFNEVVVISPRIFQDPRGYFFETFQAARYKENGIPCDFVQDNLSYSQKNTLRGLHYQHPHGQAKLVGVVRGEVLDVAVDVRKGSPTFGQWEAVTLSAENHRQLFVPEGFAHGFCVLSEDALFTYKCSDYYAPEAEHGIVWDDPDIGIVWPIEQPLLSEKDACYPRLRDVDEKNLPSFGM
jgi:dTDP-4-dehydrorhamnose 3,5-epimerase